MPFKVVFDRRFPGQVPYRKSCGHGDVICFCQPIMAFCVEQRKEYGPFSRL